MKLKLFLLGLMPVIFMLANAARAQTPGNGINFNGNAQYVSVTNFGSIIPTNEVTVEFWAYVTTATAVANFQTVPNQYPTNVFETDLTYSDGNMYWVFGNANSGGQQTQSTPGFFVGSWTHFALVASAINNSMKIYTNGNVFISKTGSSAFVRGLYELRIGGFAGSLNDFRVWNVARSQAQIQASLGSPLVGNESGLLLYYRFNAATGTIATNSASTGATFNGTLVGGATWASGAPFAMTMAASGVTANSATLFGAAYPTQSGAKYFFQYGTTTNYGSVTPAGNLGSVPTFYTYLPVSNVVSGLALHTVYHFRLIATNSFGTNAGLDQEFITLGGGAWTTATPAPDNLGTILLLTDGRVLAQNGSSNWYIMTPDSSGHYVNGTWITASNSTFEHYFCSSVVLQNGKVCIAGGEYGGDGSRYIEIYNPVSNSWTISADLGVGIADGNGILLNNGNILVEPQGTNGHDNTFLLNPNTFTLTPTTGAPIYGVGEATWVKLANDNILCVASKNISAGSTNVEYYNPGTGKWTDAFTSGIVPNIWPLLPGIVSEMGPAFLLPDGRAIFFGGNGNTAVYNNGAWSAGATIPDGQVTADSPGAMMVNGKVLLAVSPTLPSGTFGGNGPVSFYEYDYTANSGAGGYAQTSVPGGGLTFDGSTGVGAVGTEGLRMLALPDGTIMMSGVGSNIYFYTPDQSPIAAGRPTIYSVTLDGAGDLQLFGTLFNGISQGGSYGDDAQDDSNYPIVKFTDAGGKVRYGRTHDWSTTSVQTGTNILYTSCTIPAGASLQDTIQVVANGNASAGVHYPLYYNGFTIYVDYSFSGTQFGTQANPFNTIHMGYSYVENGGIISIAGGHNTTGGDGHIRISNPVRIISTSGTAKIGPN